MTEYWPRLFLQVGYTCVPCKLQPTQASTVVYTEATPSIIAALRPGVPAQLVHTFLQQLPVLDAKLTAALVGDRFMGRPFTGRASISSTRTT